MLYFLLSTLVLTLYIDVVLSLSISMRLTFQMLERPVSDRNCHRMTRPVDRDLVAKLSGTRKQISESDWSNHSCRKN